MDNWPAPSRATVFLDFDGTLVDIAPTPEAVAIPADLPDLLARLHDAVEGRLVLLTGREVAVIRRFLHRFKGQIRGCHGAEVWDGLERSVMAVDEAALAVAVRKAQDDPLNAQGMRVEHKPTGLVLHYRAVPVLEQQVIRLAERLCTGLAGFVTLSGKMSVELRPAGIGKESALMEVMRGRDFAGTTPLFFGDDATDLPALHHVQELGGVAGFVGGAPPGIALSYPAPADLRRSLQEWISHGT